MGGEGGLREENAETTEDAEVCAEETESKDSLCPPRCIFLCVPLWFLYFIQEVSRMKNAEHGD